MTLNKVVKEIFHKGKKYTLDLHSTILSRKMSNHILHGCLRYVRPKKIKERTYITSISPTLHEFMKVLEFPDHVRWFRMECKVGSLLTVECEFIPEPFEVKFGKIVTEFKKYKLIEKE